MIAVLVRRCVKHKNVVNKVQVDFAILNITIVVRVRINKKQLYFVFQNNSKITIQI